MFSYSDTHRHRLGTNYHQIPVNAVSACVHRSYQRDGPACIDGNQGSCSVTQLEQPSRPFLLITGETRYCLLFFQLSLLIFAAFIFGQSSPPVRIGHGRNILSLYDFDVNFCFPAFHFCKFLLVLCLVSLGNCLRLFFCRRGSKLLSQQFQWPSG